MRGRQGTPVARWLRAVGPDLGTTVVRSGVALLVAVRTVTVLAGVLLGVLAGEGEGAGTTLLVAAVAATVTLVTSALLLREPGPGPRLLTAALVADVLALAVGLAITGGDESPLRLLVCALPIAAAFSLPWASTVLIGTVAGGTVAALAPDVRMAVAGALSVLPGVVVAVVVARRRDVIFLRVRELAALRKDVLLRPGLEWERIGAELRQIGLEPIREVLGVLARDVRAAAAQAPRVAEAAAAVRSVVSELHALSARPTNLPVALRELTRRRAPGATVELRLDREELAPELEQLVLNVARDALAQLVRPSTRAVVLRLREDHVQTIIVDVSVSPPNAPRGGDGGAVLAERAERAGGWVRTHAGGLRIALPGALTQPRPPTRLPGGTQADALGLLVLGRTVGLAGVLLVALAAGGADPLLVPVALAALAVAPFQARIVRAGVTPFLTLAVADWVVFALLAMLVDDAKAAVMPIAVAVPVFYAFVLGPLDTIGAGVGAGAALVAGGGREPDFLLAYGWAIVVAALLSVGLNDLRRALGTLEGRHRALLGRLLDDEEERRRELAADLHDDALQLLLAARQELEESAHDPAAAGHAQAALAEGAVALARAVGEAEVDQGAERVLSGLANALAGATEPARRLRGAPHVQLDVDETAGGLHDGLLVRLVRELTVNASKHASGTQVAVRVRRTPEAVVLEVEDDGEGFDLAAVGSAVARGHVGLAFVGERVRAAGGTTELGRAEAGGALVRVSLPAAPLVAQAGRPAIV